MYSSIQRITKVHTYIDDSPLSAHNTWLLGMPTSMECLPACPDKLLDLSMTELCCHTASDFQVFKQVGSKARSVLMQTDFLL